MTRESIRRTVSGAQPFTTGARVRTPGDVCRGGSRPEGNRQVWAGRGDGASAQTPAGFWVLCSVLGFSLFVARRRWCFRFRGRLTRGRCPAFSGGTARLISDFVVGPALATGLGSGYQRPSICLQLTGLCKWSKWPSVDKVEKGGKARKALEKNILDKSGEMSYK